MEFFIFTKPIFMDKTRTIGRKWLANKLVFSFWALKRCAKFQSNPIIPSRVIVSTDAGQTNRRQETDFSD